MLSLVCLFAQPLANQSVGAVRFTDVDPVVALGHGLNATVGGSGDHFKPSGAEKIIFIAASVKK